MKKLIFRMPAAALIVLTVLIAAALCGCTEKSENPDYCREFSKAQEISIIPAGSDEPSDVISDEEEIKDFIDVLGTAFESGEWKNTHIPEDAELLGKFSFSQTETIKMGQSAEDAEMQHICDILCYKDSSYVTLKIWKLEMTFEIPDESAEYFAGFFV